MGEPHYPLFEAGDVVKISGTTFITHLCPRIGDGPWRVRGHKWGTGRHMVWLETMDGKRVADAYSSYYFEVVPFLTTVDKAAKKLLDYKPGLF